MIEIDEDLTPELRAALAATAGIVAARDVNRHHGVMLSMAVTVLCKPGGYAVSVICDGTCSPEIATAIMASVADTLQRPRQLPVVQ
jgi:hypothetical protein